MFAEGLGKIVGEWDNKWQKEYRVAQCTFMHFGRSNDGMVGLLAKWYVCSEIRGAKGVDIFVNWAILQLHQTT